MFNFLKTFSNKKEYVLVISWWGARGAYALGVLKWLEELGMDKQIKAIYGVSAWAIIGAYWAAGYTAWDIYERFVDMFSFGITKINFLPKASLLKTDFLKKIFTQDLPDQFEKLGTPLFVGAADAGTAEFHQGEYCRAALGKYGNTWDIPACSLQWYAIGRWGNLE